MTQEAASSPDLKTLPPQDLVRAYQEGTVKLGQLKDLPEDEQAKGLINILVQEKDPRRLLQNAVADFKKGDKEAMDPQNLPRLSIAVLREEAFYIESEPDKAARLTQIFEGIQQIYDREVLGKGGFRIGMPKLIPIRIGKPPEISPAPQATAPTEPVRVTPEEQLLTNEQIFELQRTDPSQLAQMAVEGRLSIDQLRGLRGARDVQSMVTEIITGASNISDIEESLKTFINKAVAAGADKEMILKDMGNYALQALKRIAEIAISKGYITDVSQPRTLDQLKDLGDSLSIGSRANRQDGDIILRLVDLVKTSIQPATQVAQSEAEEEQVVVGQVPAAEDRPRTILKPHRFDDRPEAAAQEQKQPWQMRQAEVVPDYEVPGFSLSADQKFAQQQARRDHEAAVREALQQRLPVPEEVLAEYPDLKELSQQRESPLKWIENADFEELVTRREELNSEVLNRLAEVAPLNLCRLMIERGLSLNQIERLTHDLPISNKEINIRLNITNRCLQTLENGSPYAPQQIIREVLAEWERDGEKVTREELLRAISQGLRNVLYSISLGDEINKDHPIEEVRPQILQLLKKRSKSDQEAARYSARLDMFAQALEVAFTI